MAPPIDCPATPPARPVLHDSPFSDYYTDSSPVLSAQTTKTQNALVNRLSQLAVQFTRQDVPQDVAHHVQATLDHIYALFTVPDTQTRQPADMEDSGLFIDEDSPCPSKTCYDPPATTGDDDQDDGVHEELDDVYGNMLKMSRELRQTFAGLQDNEHTLMEDLVDSMEEGETLRMENTDLRSKLKLVQRQADLLGEQVNGLRAKNQMVTAENHNLREDLHHEFNQLLNLRLHLIEIEFECARTLPGRERNDALAKSISRWRDEWDTLSQHFQRRSEQYSRIIDFARLNDGRELIESMNELIIEDGFSSRPSSSHSSRPTSSHSSGSSYGHRRTISGSELREFILKSEPRSRQASTSSKASVDSSATEHSMHDYASRKFVSACNSPHLTGADDDTSLAPPAHPPIDDTVSRAKVADPADVVSTALVPAEPSASLAQLDRVQDAAGAGAQEEETASSTRPTPPFQLAGFLSRLWSSTTRPSVAVIPRKLYGDPRMNLWDALADASSVSLYDDFYDQYNNDNNDETETQSDTA
ncbi:uncharacterized protein J3D65DRAFT_604830 [Phyllosticta citribraziliensis]|uniref:Uncharacterized protein n=1 Tax=Phyllosticta citribraziliensis TaxID=989973 RepID=A0ABR1LEW1_9PEZI